MHDHDDEHDLGLRHDLAVLATRTAPLPDPGPVRLGRRQALTLLGGGAAAALVAACSSGGGGSTARGGNGAGSTGGGSGATSTGSGSDDDAGGDASRAVPEETAGPFPGDGSNGPDALGESGIVRSDIRSSFGSLSGTAAGVPLTIRMQVTDLGAGGPAEGAAVYVWHCDRDGGYSLYGDVTDQNYLRGVQVADADGAVAFTSIFPACYQGRWPHIHFEVYASEDAIASGDPLATSQIALPAGICEAVYATDGYESSVRTLAQTSLESDMVFADGSDQQLATVTGDVDAGVTATLALAVG